MKEFYFSLTVAKSFIYILIIFAAVFGNMLVIISVMRNRKLRLVYVTLYRLSKFANL